MSLRIVFFTAELLAEEGHGSRPGLSTGAGYSISVDSYEQRHRGGLLEVGIEESHPHQ